LRKKQKEKRLVKIKEYLKEREKSQYIKEVSAFETKNENDLTTDLNRTGVRQYIQSKVDNINI
jgi:protein associated with RNAse G/E